MTSPQFGGQVRLRDGVLPWITLRGGWELVDDHGAPAILQGTATIGVDLAGRDARNRWG